MPNNYSCKITDPAKDDLEGILIYISKVLLNPTAAERLQMNLFKAFENICVFPDSHALCNIEYRRIVRKTFVSNYTIFFEHDETTVYILRVKYSLADLQNLF